MEITTEVRDGVTIVSLVGRLDFDAADSVGERLSLALARPEGVRGLVLDTTQLSYVSSAGLRIVLTLAKDANEAGVPLAIAALQADVARVFEVSGLTSSKILDIEPTVEAAIAAVTA